MRDEEKTKEQLISELASLRESLHGCTDALRARTQDLDDVAHYVVSEFKRPLGLVIGLAEVLEAEHGTLPQDEIRQSIKTIKESGHRMGRMVNALLLLANSRRLFDNVWYSAYLAAMEEPILSQWAQDEADGIGEAYRFTCLPAFSAPFIVRVWESGDRTTRLRAVAKFGSDLEDDDRVGVLPQQAEWSLDEDEWHSLLRVVEESEFWTDATTLERMGWLRMVGTDSEEWVFEGWRAGQHRVRMAWSPDGQKTPAVYALGKSFVKLLPAEFALTMARLWAADFEPDTHSRFREIAGLSSLL